MQDDTTKLPKRNGGRGLGFPDWRLLTLSAVLGAAGGGTLPILAPEIVRPMPFTSAEARDLRREIRLEMREHYYRLCSGMPPGATRARIAKLEGWISQRDPLYTPGALDWNTGKCGD